MSGEKKVYFDNAATTPMREEVKQAMMASLDSFGNPSSIHSFGRASKVLIEKARKNILVPEAAEDLDGLAYLQGKDVDFVNKKATDGVLLAHTDGGVPNMFVTLPEQDEFTLGYTIYFFELAIALSGYLNGINPFDQPGVEAYKKNMFALLGKPGFEELGAELNARL